MSKKRKCKRSRRSRTAYTQAEQSPTLRLMGIPSPWSSLSATEFDALARKIGETGSQKFDEAFAELQERLTQFHPLLLLATLSLYELTLPPEKNKPHLGKEPLYQHHVELLQALVLQHPRDTFSWMPPFPDVPPFVDLLDLASRMFFVRRIGPADDGPDGERLRIQEVMRLETQSVRNWGYFHQTRRITIDLFAPLDDRIHTATGVRVVDLMEMWERIVKQIYQRIAEHHRREHGVAHAQSIPAMCQAITESADEAQALEATLTAIQPGIGPWGVKEQLLSHLQYQVPAIYTLTIDDFCNAYPNPVDPVALQAALKLWSLNFGQLADDDPEHFFLRNPVWMRPLIHLGDDRFFFPIPDLFQSFGLQMMEELIRENDPLWEAYGQHRGRFLEDETARLFAKAFPSATLFRGSTWRDPENLADEWENDLLVMLDAYAIVVEAKAGRFADRARRGDVGSLRKQIAELVVRPSQQSARFADYLLQNPEIHRFPSRRRTENVVDAQEIRGVVRISVTLDSLGRLGSRWPAIQEAELAVGDQELAPTISLADLQSIFELLEGQVMKLHYLVRRAEFERNAIYIGDEFDLLALYVETGFNIGEAEFAGQPLWLENKHETLDPFFRQLATGRNPKKPKFAMTRWWRELVAMVEAVGAPRWTMTGLRLLNVSHQDQARFEKRFRSYQHIVRTCWKNPGHQDMVHGTFGPAQRLQTIVGLAYRRLTATELRSRMKQAGEIALESADTEDAVVIGVDAEGRRPPATAVLHMINREVPRGEPAAAD